MSQISPILVQKLVAMDTSLEGSQIPGYPALPYVYTNPESLVKIGPLDSEPLKLEVDH